MRARPAAPPEAPHEEGEVTDDQSDVGRSLAQDQKREAENESKRGQGDRGDRKS